MAPIDYLKTAFVPLFVALFMCPYISAQNFLNGNFENWTMVGETLEPSGWTTSNYSNNPDLPISAHLTENACMGQFALKLTSTAISLEGPGPGYAHQYIDLDEPASSATITFSYAADTLLNGAFGRINLGGIDTSDENPVMIAFESLIINELTQGCVYGTLTINSTEPFDQIFIEMRAEPHYTGLSTEGLSVIRFDNIQLDVALSVNDRDLSGQLTVMPNPTQGVLHLQYDNLRIHDIQLMDLSGKILHQIPVTSHSVDLSDLPSGTYLMKIISEDGLAVKKVVKE